MTLSRIQEIVNSGADLDYELGREAAQQAIADGALAMYSDMSTQMRIHGVEWCQGFYDYVNAWKMINR